MQRQRQQEAALLPVYLAVGEDALKRDAVARRLRARLAALGDLSFNADEFNGERATGEEIVEACNTLPFASPKRLVEVSGADKLKKADAEKIVSYLEKPNESSVLALAAEKLSRGTRLYKAVARFGATALIDCAAPRRQALPRMIRSMAERQGVCFTEGAASKLLDLVGEDTLRLDNEVKKVALALQPGASVGEREVLALVSRTTEAKPWEFVDAFSARDLRACLNCYRHMESVSPHALLALCAARLRELVCARAMADRGQPRSLAAALGMPDWRVKNHAAWARGFSAAELRRALVSSRDAERAMKSGSDPHTAFLDWALGVAARR